MTYKPVVMATKEIKKELKLALAEIGEIKPWFDKNFKIWVFSHALYPVECEGQSADEVIKKYPKYLEVFIEHRMHGTLDVLNEKKTKGRGGARQNAGRPTGTKKEPTKQVRIPLDIAEWLKTPGVIPQIRSIMQAYKQP
jgi:hypothetical protein